MDVAKFMAIKKFALGQLKMINKQTKRGFAILRFGFPSMVLVTRIQGLFISTNTNHVTRAFIQMAAEHSLYDIAEPSHKRIILQVADRRINRFVEEQYTREYTAGMCTTNVSGRIFDDTERIGCSVRTLNSLDKKRYLIAN